MLESIHKVRRETIEKLLTIAYSQVNRYEACTAKVCQERNDSDRCDALSYGSLTLGLRKTNLWPSQTTDRMSRSDWSVKILSSRISNLIVLVTAPSGQNYARSDHTNCCDSSFKAKVEEVMSKIESPVLDSHRVHMRDQRGEKI
jgi:hypothetical protein